MFGDEKNQGFKKDCHWCPKNPDLRKRGHQ